MIELFIVALYDLYVPDHRQDSLCLFNKIFTIPYMMPRCFIFPPPNAGKEDKKILVQIINQ